MDVSTVAEPIGVVDAHAFSVATERLRLRPLKQADWPIYRHLYTDPDTMRGVGDPLTGSAVEKSFAICLREWTRQPLRRVILAVTDTREGGTIGVCGIFNFREDSTVGSACAEVGVMLVAAAQACGLGPEALRAVIACAFGNFPLDTVSCHVSTLNARSERMISRIGFEPIDAQPDPGPFARRTWVLSRDRFTPA